jgi:hypothetical protein
MGTEPNNMNWLCWPFHTVSNTNLRSKRQYRTGGEASRPLRQGILEIDTTERNLV